jgi:DNA repair exonuclease SbcCD ATPase subunit
MGNLIINKVIYSGEQYHYESPKMKEGINILIGDNGSGKSTFTYFIEYCLGGNLKYFSSESKKEKYLEIINDINNYVELEISVNNETYKLKRFINTNDIFINQGDSYFSFPINRINDNVIFSDWLLEKLDITVSELNLGTRTWKINISDLLRLIVYDQDTESKKIYKEPSTVNFITDSLIIRKTIFEVLLGISSDEYFKKHDEFKEISKRKDLAVSKLDDFNEKYSGIDLDITRIKTSLEHNTITLEKLYNERALYLSTNTKIDKKTELVYQVQEDLIRTDLQISDTSINLKNRKIEFDKISKLFESQTNEIYEIEKIIFTHDKLDLFSFKICPFCMTPHTPKENHCLCGAEIVDKDYEKFVYNSNEYKQILNHKKKSLETIQVALDSYAIEINKYTLELEKLNTNSKSLTEKLKQLIGAIEFSGNSELIDSLNDKILETRKEIDKFVYLQKVTQEKETLEELYDTINNRYKQIKGELEKLYSAFEEQNKNIIQDFNFIYKELLSQSSAEITSAEIDSDYMPVIDGGIYKNKSTDVPVRLMYYLTILALALKYGNVKHPKLLIIDTPENSGIDIKNLNNDLLLLEKALELGTAKDKSYQIILTTGLEKYPTEFNDYVFEKFNKKQQEFILKSKNN